jgi:hypothetical protein
MPASGTDPACPLLLCSRGNTACRKFRDERLCAEVGRCVEQMEWPSCKFDDLADGTSCLDGWHCEAGVCVK